MEHIDSYFGKESNLSCMVGTFPEKHSPDYCWGGCPGALQEAMHIFKGYLANVNREMKNFRYIVGRIDGALKLDEEERVIFAEIVPVGKEELMAIMLRSKAVIGGLKRWMNVKRNRMICC